MSDKKAIFDRATLDTIASLYGISRPYAEMAGIDPFLAMGGPAEELHSLNDGWVATLGHPAFDHWVGGLPDWVPGWLRQWDYTHEDIKQNMVDARSVDQSKGVEVVDKALNPTLVDLGIGNIKLGTAIELLGAYNRKYPDSDPFDLKKYNDRYDRLARDLTMFSPLNATAKFSVLEAAEAVDFFKSRAPATWAKADLAERLGLVATYYNRGREKMSGAAQEAEPGEYRPVPGFGGEQAAASAQALALAVGRDLPFGEASLAAGRTGDRISVPGYSGDGGRRRDNQDPRTYGDWRSAARQGRPGAPHGARSDRGPERRSQAEPLPPAGGLLGKAAQRASADVAGELFGRRFAGAGGLAEGASRAVGGLLAGFFGAGSAGSDRPRQHMSPGRRGRSRNRGPGRY